MVPDFSVSRFMPASSRDGINDAMCAPDLPPPSPPARPICSRGGTSSTPNHGRRLRERLRCQTRRGHGWRGLWRASGGCRTARVVDGSPAPRRHFHRQAIPVARVAGHDRRRSMAGEGLNGFSAEEGWTRVARAVAEPVNPFPTAEISVAICYLPCGDVL